MPVFRVKKNKNFTSVNNLYLSSMNLTISAKGLLTHMLSLPENWDYTLSGLAHIEKSGICAIRTAIKELESEGYITRTRIRDKNGRLMTMEYTIYEVPVHEFEAYNNSSLSDQADTSTTSALENDKQENEDISVPTEIENENEASGISENVKEAVSEIQADTPTAPTCENRMQENKDISLPAETKNRNEASWVSENVKETASEIQADAPAAPTCENRMQENKDISLPTEIENENEASGISENVKEAASEIQVDTPAAPTCENRMQENKDISLPDETKNRNGASWVLENVKEAASEIQADILLHLHAKIAHNKISIILLTERIRV